MLLRGLIYNKVFLLPALNYYLSFHTRTMQLDTIKAFIYLPTDAQLNCL